jgi:hypothetical protein
LRPVVADQVLQPVGVLRQPLAGHAAERFEVARLRGDEVAREAELAVDDHHAPLERGGFARQLARGLAEARHFTPAVAHRQQPQRDDQQHRHGQA